MKAIQQKVVMQAVQKNIRIYTLTGGEGAIVGTDDFTPEMEKLFDTLYEKYIDQLNN